MILKTNIRGRLRIFRSFRDYFTALYKKGCCVYQPITITLLQEEDTPICDGTNIDFTSYTQMNLLPFGGEEFTPITSNQDIIDAFAALGITVTVEGCTEIIITAGYYGTETELQLILT